MCLKTALTPSSCLICHIITPPLLRLHNLFCYYEKGRSHFCHTNKQNSPLHLTHHTREQGAAMTTAPREQCVGTV